MGIKKTIEFKVQGSNPDPYKVRFFLDGNSLITTCTCQAGEMGTYCKHRLRILLNNPDDIVSGNIDDVKLVVEHLKQSTLNAPIQNFLDADAAFANAKTDLSIKTKKLSAALLGKVYGK